MAQDGMVNSDHEAGSVSVGQGDQGHERQMEEQQRWQDEGVGVPPEANPHAQINRIGRNDQPKATRSATKAKRGEDHQPWQGREDDPAQPGQTPEGGLGGSGPAQP